MRLKNNLYETDFYAWCLTQASQLESKEIKNLDWENLKEEIESLGNAERKELVTFLELLFRHLLKCKFQKEYKTRSWLITIKNQRINIRDLLDRNPSLKPKIIECCELAYEKARLNAADETHLDEEVFPEKNPFSYEWALKEGWFPEGEN